MLHLFSDEVRRDPFPLYDQIRSASPVLRVPEIDTWMIFDYAGVKQALADHDAFSNNLAVASRGNPARPAGSADRAHRFAGAIAEPGAGEP